MVLRCSPFLPQDMLEATDTFHIPVSIYEAAEAYATDCPYSLHRVDFQLLAARYRTPLVSYAENPPSSRFAWGNIALYYSELNGPRLSPSTFPELTC